MNSSKNRLSVSQKKETEKKLSDVQSRVSNEEIIRRAANDKKSSKLLNSVPRPQSKISTSQKDINPKPVSKTNEIQASEQLSYIKTHEQDNTSTQGTQIQSQIPDRNLQQKVKEKSREIQSLKDKVTELDQKNQDLTEQLKSYKSLLEKKIDNASYIEKRTLIMTQTILNQKLLIKQYTRMMKLTKVMQVELEFQLQSIGSVIEQYLNKQDNDIMKATEGFKSFIERTEKKLQYSQSQQNYNNFNDNFDGKQKNNDSSQKQTVKLVKAEACIAQILNHYEQINDVSFLKSNLYESLSCLGLILLQEFNQQKPPKIILPDNKSFLAQHLIRVQGKFTSLFPYFNDTREIITRNVQNDRIFQYLESQEIELKELQHLTTMGPNIPSASAYFLIKSIAILKQLLIHTLLSIHTQQLNPQFKKLKEFLLPFCADCLGVINEYGSNQGMGAQVLWGLWSGRANQINNSIDEIMGDFSSMKKQHQGLWNQILNQDYFSQSNV